MSQINDGGPVRFCAWCPTAAIRKQGRIWLCVAHYRFQQMRVLAKRRGLVVPTYEQLADMLSRLGMICPGCQRQMNWLSADGQTTVISLQHDRDGTLRFLCRSCNTRHASFEGDSFYEVGPNRKRCFRCKLVKPLNLFKTDSRWGGKGNACKECATILHREWTRKNRESYNAKQRAYRAARKLAGNRVRGGGR